jgi:hypothetical protein
MVSSDPLQGGPPAKATLGRTAVPEAPLMTICSLDPDKTLRTLAEYFAV